MPEFKLRGIVKGHENIGVNNTGDEARKVTIQVDPQVGGSHSKAPFVLGKDFARDYFPIDQHVEITVISVAGPAEQGALPLDEAPQVS